MEPNEIDLAVAKALEAFEARQAAKAAREAELEAARKEAVDKVKAELKAEAEAKAKAWYEEKAAPALMKVAKPGSGGKTGPNEAFMHFLKTGDVIAASRELTESDDAGEKGRGTDAESRKVLSSASGAAGEYLVPDDFVASIVAKRDPQSFVRKMGVQVLQTNLKVVDIPAESTSLTKFARTAESGAYSTNDPAFAQNQVTVEKWTKVTKFSDELLADNAAGLDAWYTSAVARAMATTEAYYVAIGNGTNQHEGIFEGGDTDAFTYNTDNGLDSDNPTVINLGVLWNHYADLGAGYRDDAAWLTKSATMAAIVGSATTKIATFGGASMLEMGGDGIWRLLGRPMYIQEDIPSKAASVGFIAFGSPAFYVLVERAGLTVSRNPYLYQANGQIGIFTSFRQSGKVTVEEAWNIGVGA
jgi:HK97 family phage major capsid protein